MEKATYEDKEYCLISEIKTAQLLFAKGMGDLSSLTRGMDTIRYSYGWIEYVFVPMLLLSSSLERLFKCLLCLILLKEDGEFEEAPYTHEPGKGHNLNYLLNRLLEVITNPKYRRRYLEAESDVKYLKDNKALKRIVDTLSDFGQGDRYYNLNVVLNGKSEQISPVQAWDGIEMGMIFITRGREEVAKIPRNERMLETQKDIVKTIERLDGIIVRLLRSAGFDDFL